MVHPGEEEERFNPLTIEYMSEESDPDENGNMAVHQPNWHSESKDWFTFFLMITITDLYLSRID